MALDSDTFDEQRRTLNNLLATEDPFFADFGQLDDVAYGDGAITKSNKELIGLAISVVTHCEECVAYHMEGASAAGATRRQVVEVLRMGLIGAGSVAMPTVRFAASLLDRYFPKTRD